MHVVPCSAEVARFLLPGLQDDSMNGKVGFVTGLTEERVCVQQDLNSGAEIIRASNLRVCKFGPVRHGAQSRIAPLALAGLSSSSTGASSGSASATPNTSTLEALAPA